MENKNKLLTEEELMKQLLEIRNSKEAVLSVKNNYGIPVSAVSDLRQMDDKKFESFIKHLNTMIEEMQNGKKYVKIASEKGIGSNIVLYIGKVSVEDFNSIRVEEEYYNYVKKIEDMWKKSLLGEDEFRLSREYNMPLEEVQERIGSYNSLIERYQVRFCNQSDIHKKEQLKQRLRKKYYFGEDTLEYIFSKKNKDVFNKEAEKYMEYEEI